MTPQQRKVHERLMAMLPVRTHLKPQPEQHQRRSLGLTMEQTDELRREIRSLRAKGKTPAEIGKIVDRSMQTVYNYLRNR